MRTSAAHLAPRALLHPVLARPLCARGSLPLSALLLPITITRLELELELELLRSLLDELDVVFGPDLGLLPPLEY